MRPCGSMARRIWLRAVQICEAGVPVGLLALLAAFTLATLSGILHPAASQSSSPAPLHDVASGPASPSAAINLAPSGAVPQGTPITATMTFGGLAFDADTSDVDYIFRADVVDADACEGNGLGVNR